MSYTNKTVVITGAAKGIGASCAKLFYEAGGIVLFRKEDGLQLTENNFLFQRF